MSSEKDWMDDLTPKLESLLGSSTNNMHTKVMAGVRLTYRNEVFSYKSDGTPPKTKLTSYQTDLLVREELDGGLWVPRVVIELKLGVHAHDAIIYNAKADTHKQVHPYLRYGILIGDNEGEGLPLRLFRHGAYFDFMAVWRKAMEPSDEEWNGFVNVIREEIEASRRLEELLRQRHAKYSLVHRRLILKSL